MKLKSGGPRPIILAAALAAVSFWLLLAASQSAGTAAAPGRPGVPDLGLANAFPNIDFDMENGITALASAGDDRLFFALKQGTIRVSPLAPTSITATMFLDLRDRVHGGTFGGERGLLGLTFDPQYATNGYFYVNYTHNVSAGVQTTRVSRFQVTADPNVGDPDSELVLLELVQPYSNHNGGDLKFGPDGLLYIAMGDGGGAGDPDERAQDLADPLGKMLRIDVDGGGLPPDCDPDGNYTVPDDNPFVGNGACDEIWAYGLRNPWRFSFDSQTGDLFTGDVGQGQWEEVDHQPAASAGGENYGWDCYEGNQPYETEGCDPDPGAYSWPIDVYDHNGPLGYRCAVTGGFVYRGQAYPSLDGIYFFGDYCSHEIWGLIENGGGWTNFGDPLALAPADISTFGVDHEGEVYLATRGTSPTAGGFHVYRLQADAVEPTPSPTGTATATLSPTASPTATPTPTPTPSPTPPAASWRAFLPVAARP